MGATVPASRSQTQHPTSATARLLHGRWSGWRTPARSVQPADGPADTGSEVVRHAHPRRQPPDRSCDREQTDRPRANRRRPAAGHGDPSQPTRPVAGSGCGRRAAGGRMGHRVAARGHAHGRTPRVLHPDRGGCPDVGNPRGPDHGGCGHWVGAHAAQGYLLGRPGPLPVAATAAAIAAGHRTSHRPHQLTAGR